MLAKAKAHGLLFQSHRSQISQSRRESHSRRRPPAAFDDSSDFENNDDAEGDLSETTGSETSCSISSSDVRPANRKGPFKKGRDATPFVMLVTS